MRLRSERALAVGIFNSGTNVGAVVAPLCVPFIAATWGWQMAFLLTGALGFGKDNQAGAAIDGVLCEAPHALQVRGAAQIRDGNIAEALHQPAICRDFEVRFQLPSANHLGHSTIQNKWVKQVDVIDHEK